MFWAARALHWCIQRVFPGPRGMGNLLKVHRARDRLLQLLVFNEEFLVDVVHQTASITSLPFVHTARRSYRLNAQVSHSDLHHAGFRFWWGKVLRTLSFRGRRSRNKVSVGEPAEGSFARIVPNNPIMIFASRATVTCDIEKLSYTFFFLHFTKLSSEISLSSKILQWWMSWLE